MCNRLGVNLQMSLSSRALCTLRRDRANKKLVIIHRMEVENVQGSISVWRSGAGHGSLLKASTICTSCAPVLQHRHTDLSGPEPRALADWKCQLPGLRVVEESRCDPRRDVAPIAMAGSDFSLSRTLPQGPAVQNRPVSLTQRCPTCARD